MEMMLTGKKLSAQAALHWGLVNQVVPGAALITEALALANRINTSAPLAQRAIKALVNNTEFLSLEESFALQRSGAILEYEQMLRSEDALEGTLAFSQKRPPAWKGNEG